MLRSSWNQGHRFALRKRWIGACMLAAEWAVLLCAGPQPGYPRSWHQGREDAAPHHVQGALWSNVWEVTRGLLFFIPASIPMAHISLWETAATPSRSFPMENHPLQQIMAQNSKSEGRIWPSLQYLKPVVGQICTSLARCLFTSLPCIAIDLNMRLKMIGVLASLQLSTTLW